MIDPAAGFSDNGWPCTMAGFDPSNTPQKCVVWQLEADPNSPPAFSSVDFKIYQIPSDMNTRFLRNEALDITTFVKLADPGGTRSSFSVYSLNQATVAASTSCGYRLLSRRCRLSSGTLHFGSAAENCSTGPFLKNLIPRLLVRLVKTAPRTAKPSRLRATRVITIYRLQADGKTTN